MSTAKTDKWLQSIKETREKRENQDCKVFSLKFDKSKLSKEKTDYLRLLFAEAKWLYNHILSSGNILQYDTKTDRVNARDKDGNMTERKLVRLSSQMKQAVRQRMLYAMKSLKTRKERGYKIGGLKYRRRVDSIVLNQFNITYKIINGNKLKLQGFSKCFRLEGLFQIPKNAEWANATLTRKNGNYYLKVTSSMPKESPAF